MGSSIANQEQFKDVGRRYIYNFIFICLIVFKKIYWVKVKIIIYGYYINNYNPNVVVNIYQGVVNNVAKATSRITLAWIINIQLIW